MDPLGSTLDRTQALAQHEWDEWGNPWDEESLAYISSYSPLSNISLHADTGPAFLLSVGLHDVRVPPRESMEWVQLVRRSRQHWSEEQQAKRPVLLNVRGDAGHDGPLSVEEQCLEDAREVAFLEHVLCAS